MSEFDRRTGVKHLRVRGIKAVRFSVFMKAIGLNILRAAAYAKNTNKSKIIEHNGKTDGLFCPRYAVVKELWAMLLRQSGIFPSNNFLNCRPNDFHIFRLAA